MPAGSTAVAAPWAPSVAEALSADESLADASDLEGNVTDDDLGTAALTLFAAERPAEDENFEDTSEAVAFTSPPPPTSWRLGGSATGRHR